MRVAFITVGDPQRLTGGYLYHEQVFRRLRGQGWQIDEVNAGTVPLAAQEQAAQEFGARFELRGYDVLVLDMLARGVCAPHVARWRRSTPVVAMVHQLPSEAEPDTSAPHDRANENALLHADAVIAVSNHGREVLLRRGIDGARIHVVSPGFDRVGAATRRTDTHANIALCVAQWIPRKGIDVLAEAWRMRRGSGGELVLVGETEADTVYATTVRERLRGAANVTIAGPVSDDALIDLYRRAALFVLPSRFEGYGMVYAEALGYDLPVLACAVGPVPELVGDGGVLVPPDDPAALAAALDRVLGDESLRARLSAAATERAGSLPGWDDTAAGFAAALQAAVGQQR